MKLDHISAVCSSYGNAIRFYNKMLDMKEAKNFSIDRELTFQIFGVSCGCQIVQFENKNCAIEVFIPEQKVEVRNPFVHHCIVVDDRDVFVALCLKEKLSVNCVPKGDKQLVFIEDFDGNLYEVKD